MARMKQNKGFNVAEFVAERGAPETAIEWARPYGTDLRRFWDECERGEFMVSIATNLQVPFGCVVQAAVECVTSSMDGVDDRFIPGGIRDAIEVIERFTVAGGYSSELKEVLLPLQELIKGYRDRGQLDHPTHRYLEAVLSLGSAYFMLPVNLSQAHIHLSQALQAAAHARVAIVRQENVPMAVCRYVYNQALGEFAGRVRTFIPFEVLVGGVMKTAIIYRAMHNGEEIAEEMES